MSEFLTFLGLALLIAAGSVNDTLPDAQFFAWSVGLAIPGFILGWIGTRGLR